MTTTEKKKMRSKFQPTGCWIRPDARLAIYLRDSFRCLYCDKDLRDADPRDIHLDHLVCKSDGGSNDPSNLICCCRSCNCSRQDRPWRTFASPEARKAIARNVKRSLIKYRTLAKAIISGQADASELENG